MRYRPMAIAMLTLTMFIQGGLVAQAPGKRTAKDGLRALNDLIGLWRGTGTPAGTKQEQQDGFWAESIAWEWQFKDKDVWFSAVFEKSKHFSKGALRYVPEKNEYSLALTTTAKQEKVFTGALSDNVLTLDGSADANGDVERLVFTLLHDNRHLYRLDKKKADRASFANVFKVGATKEGMEFAGGTGKPECIVTGGLGTIAVLHNGATYYVCCSGCATEFRADPAKYVKEFEEKKKGKK